MFASDDPRGLVNYFWLWWFPVFDALPVALASTVPLPFAGRRRPVSLLRLPLRPFPCRIPAPFAAIALTRLPRMKALLASFQQTTAPPRPAQQSSRPTLLIFGMGCSTLGRAHGR